MLSIIARDLLTPPVSTIASEFTFSTSGIVLNDRRSTLAGKTLNSLTCLQDWEAVDRCTQQRWHNKLVKEMSSLNMEPVTIHCDAIVDDDDNNDDNTRVEVDDNEDED